MYFMVIIKRWLLLFSESDSAFILYFEWSFSSEQSESKVGSEYDEIEDILELLK